MDLYFQEILMLMGKKIKIQPKLNWVLRIKWLPASGKTLFHP